MSLQAQLRGQARRGARPERVHASTAAYAAYWPEGKRGVVLVDDVCGYLLVDYLVKQRGRPTIGVSACAKAFPVVSHIDNTTNLHMSLISMGHEH